MHTFSENPFGCKFTPINGMAVFYKTLLFLLGFILIPLVFVLGPILCGIGYGFAGGFYCIGSMSGCIRYGVCYNCNILVKIFMFFISLPVFCIVLAFCIAIGALGTALATLAIIPALLIHSWMYFRTIYWWNKSKSRKKKPKIQKNSKMQEHLIEIPNNQSL